MESGICKRVSAVLVQVAVDNFHQALIAAWRVGDMEVGRHEPGRRLSSQGTGCSLGIVVLSICSHCGGVESVHQGLSWESSVAR